MPRFLLAVATLAVICVLPAFALSDGDAPDVRPRAATVTTVSPSRTAGVYVHGEKGQAHLVHDTYYGPYIGLREPGSAGKGDAWAVGWEPGVGPLMQVRGPDGEVLHIELVALAKALEAIPDKPGNDRQQMRPAVLHFGNLPPLAAKPMPQPCPCGPECRCMPCRCGQQMAAEDPLANGVLLARLNQRAEDRRPLLPAAEERLIERKQIEGLLSSIASFVGGALEFFMVWQWMKTSLWMIPAAIVGAGALAGLGAYAGLCRVANAIVLAGRCTMSP